MPHTPTSGRASRATGGLDVGARVLDRYAIVERLGRGATADVYEALDADGGRVAIKVLRAHWLHREDVRLRFAREAAVAQRIRHPAVVRIHEVATLADGTCLQVMDCVDGITLESYAEGRRLPLPDVVTVGRQLAAGLAAAHREGVVHRDLKPENVIVNRDCGLPTCTIIDFGVAHIRATIPLTAPGSVLGTPRYMAPEQALPGEPIDARADVYALGCVLFELLTGQPPYRGDDPMQIAFAHLTEPSPEVRDLRPEVPEALALVVERCLAKDAGDRFADGAAVVAALAAVAPCAASALPSGAGPHLGRPARVAPSPRADVGRTLRSAGTELASPPSLPRDPTPLAPGGATVPLPLRRPLRRRGATAPLPLRRPAATTVPLPLLHARSGPQPPRRELPEASDDAAKPLSGLEPRFGALRAAVWIVPALLLAALSL